MFRDAPQAEVYAHPIPNPYFLLDFRPHDAVRMRIPKALQADLALVAVTFIWGSGFTFAKQGLSSVSPVLFVALRFWVAALAMGICMPGLIRSISRDAFLKGCGLAAVLLGAFVFQTAGLQSTTPSYSAFITSLCVLMVPLLGLLLYRDRPGPRLLAGIGLATLGLCLLLVKPGDLRIRPGDVWTLGGAFLFALQILLLGHVVTNANYRQLQLVQMAGAAVLGTVLVPVLETPRMVWSAALAFYLFMTGALATALAFYVQASAQRLTTPNRAALIFSLEPVFAALFAYWILGHRLALQEWIGGALVLAGILISELRISAQRPNESGE